MPITKRDFLQKGATAAAGFFGTVQLGVWTPPAMAKTAMRDLTGDRYSGPEGDVMIHPVAHASLVIGAQGKTIYVDPVGPQTRYENVPPPDLILVTHEHQDHFNVERLRRLAGEQTDLIANPAVLGKLPADLAAKASAMQNGQTTNWRDITIEAVPAYNYTKDRLQYHPKGRDNGYVLNLSGQRVYVAGDTEDIPEMGRLGSIDIAFLPMNLPFTMTVEQAANAVDLFKPRHVYPYHYRGSAIDVFERMVSAQGGNSKVVRFDWYADA